jgi:hypothetical protein
MRAPLIVIVLASVGGAVCAQAADEGFKELDTCFQLARAADAICSDPKNGAAERLDCRQKASKAQLECLERLFPGGSAGSVPSEKPPRTVSPEMPTVTGSPEVPAGSVSPETPTGTVAKGGPTSSQKTPPGTVPPEMHPRTVSPAMPIVTGSPEVPAGSVSPETPTGTVAKGEPTSSQKTPPGTGPPEIPPRTVSPAMPTVTGLPDKPTGTVSPDVPAKSVDIPAKPADTNWVVSQTTSPVDYSPLITAVIRSTSSVQDAPNALAIRCRGRRTELLVRTQGTWQASRTREVQVDYQINDQPSVRLPWTVPADGRTAIYKDDAVGLLQSLPEGARLKINVFDRAASGHEATFQLAGLDAVRKKMAVPCDWPAAADKKSWGKR